MTALTTSRPATSHGSARGVPAVLVGLAHLLVLLAVSAAFGHRLAAVGPTALAATGVTALGAVAVGALAAHLWIAWGLYAPGVMMVLTTLATVGAQLAAGVAATQVVAGDPVTAGSRVLPGLLVAWPVTLALVAGVGVAEARIRGRRLWGAVAAGDQLGPDRPEPAASASPSKCAKARQRALRPGWGRSLGVAALSGAAIVAALGLGVLVPHGVAFGAGLAVWGLGGLALAIVLGVLLALRRALVLPLAWLLVVLQWAAIDAAVVRMGGVLPVTLGIWPLVLLGAFGLAIPESMARAAWRRLRPSTPAPVTVGGQV